MMDVKGWWHTCNCSCCPATPICIGIQVPLFIQHVLTENIKMSPGSLLKGDVLGRGKVPPTLESFNTCFPWLCGLSSHWWGWRGLDG